LNFYDTCSLLDLGEKVYETDSPFYISMFTLSELEKLKTDKKITEEKRFKVKRAIRLLNKNHDKYKLVLFQKEWKKYFDTFNFLLDITDSYIIISAYVTSLSEDITFVTSDFSCNNLGAAVGLKVIYNTGEGEDTYRGYIEVQPQTEEELIDLYEKIYDKDNFFGLVDNEYLLVKDADGNIIDQYRHYSKGNERVEEFPIFKSRLFGDIKPKDAYQKIAMDSLLSNKITLLRGPSGVGKSYLSMAYLVSLLDKGEISKIVMFCNTVATAGAAKLGFYPGDKDLKLIDSQIGNFLSSKIGCEKELLQDMIDEGKLLLLPMSDIRGYDTSGMNAGIYITEAQNLNIDLIKLALQRIGEDCICILDGDDKTQVDLDIYAGDNNGIRRVSQVFRGHDCYGEVTLVKNYRSQISELAEQL